MAIALAPADDDDDDDGDDSEMDEFQIGEWLMEHGDEVVQAAEELYSGRRIVELYVSAHDDTKIWQTEDIVIEDEDEGDDEDDDEDGD